MRGDVHPRYRLWQAMKPLTSYGHSHPRAAARIRLAVGIWLLALTAYLCYRGIWWGLLLLAPAVLHFYLAYRSHHSIQN